MQKLNPSGTTEEVKKEKGKGKFNLEKTINFLLCNKLVYEGLLGNSLYVLY